MKNKTIPALAALAALTFAGCENNNARYIDSNGSENVISLGKVNIQDFARVSDQTMASFIASPAFGRMKNAPKPPVIAVSTVRNDTADRFDTDLLTQKIINALTDTGAVEVSATVGGNADALTQELGAAQDFSSGKNAAGRAAPDYTLVAKIMEDRAGAGDTKQTSYIFQVKVNDVAKGTQAWGTEKTVSKQGSKDSVGL